MTPALDIHYMTHFPCSTWVQGRVPRMPISLSIRTSSMVAGLVQYKVLGGRVFSGTITRQTVVLFSRSCIFGLYFTTKALFTMNMNT